MDYMKHLRSEPQCHEEPRLEGLGRRLLHDPNDRGMGAGMDPRQQGQFGGGRGGRGGPMGGPGGPGGPPGDERWMKRQGAPVQGVPQDLGSEGLGLSQDLGFEGLVFVQRPARSVGCVLRGSGCCDLGMRDGQSAGADWARPALHSQRGACGVGPRVV